MRDFLRQQSCSIRGSYEYMQWKFSKCLRNRRYWEKNIPFNVALLKNPLSTATLNFQLSDNCCCSLKERIFPEVATGRTVGPSGPHASREQCVVRAWFRLSVLGAWASRTEEMTGVYGEWLRNWTQRDTRMNSELRFCVGQVRVKLVLAYILASNTINF
jgi:hypothetical protein